MPIFSKIGSNSDLSAGYSSPSFDKDGGGIPDFHAEKIASTAGNGLQLSYTAGKIEQHQKCNAFTLKFNPLTFFFRAIKTLRLFFLIGENIEIVPF